MDGWMDVFLSVLGNVVILLFDHRRSVTDWNVTTDTEEQSVCVKGSCGSDLNFSL